MQTRKWLFEFVIERNVKYIETGMCHHGFRKNIPGIHLVQLNQASEGIALSGNRSLVQCGHTITPTLL